MNTPLNEIPTSYEEDTIMHQYVLGLEYYQESLRVCGQKKTGKLNREYAENQREDYQKLSSAHCKNALLLTGTSQEQLGKIPAALLLLKLQAREGKEAQEFYFYHAVELAYRYLGDEFYGSAQEGDIIDAYLSTINSTFRDISLGPYMTSFLPIVRLMILAELNKRTQERMIGIENLTKHLSENLSPDEMLSKIEDLLGPIRLLIISKESEEVLVSHRVSPIDIPDIKKTSPYFFHTREVYIFDRPGSFLVMIDHGSHEPENQFPEYQLKNSIYPLIDIYIAKKEYAFFTLVMDNISFVECSSPYMQNMPNADTYEFFIKQVISHTDLSHTYTSGGGEEYIKNCTQAIDICRMIMLQNNESNQEYIIQEIDSLLGGEIQRGVFHMVQSMILSCHETMNGTGYPFGLSKKNISLEGKIFSIIRAYEALYAVKNNSQKSAITSLYQWAQGGYFDSQILQLFVESLSLQNLSEIPEEHIPVKPVSSYRSMYYRAYLEKWSDMITIMNTLEENYAIARQTDDISMRNSLFLQISKLRLDIRRKADIRKIIILTRHGETESDDGEGPPGDDSEILSEQGETSSLKKGELVADLDISIRRSPILRAEQTANLIHSKMSESMASSMTRLVPILSEEILRNPPKYKDNGRYNSFAEQLFKDNANTIMNFLIQLVSSSEETMNLLITHKDISRHMIFWLSNLFATDTISGEKVSIKNNTLYPFFFRGDHLIQGVAEENDGLLFPFFGWKEIINDVNTITRNIFGESFYELQGIPINLIALHDRFLDFIDYQREKSPEKVGVCIDLLSENPRTHYFPGILTKDQIWLYAKK